MCICELPLHRRVKGRRDDKGLGYTTATISSAHRVIVYARPDEERKERVALAAYIVVTTGADLQPPSRASSSVKLALPKRPVFAVASQGLLW